MTSKVKTISMGIVSYISLLDLGYAVFEPIQSFRIIGFVHISGYS